MLVVPGIPLARAHSMASGVATTLIILWFASACSSVEPGHSSAAISNSLEHSNLTVTHIAVGGWGAEAGFSPRLQQRQFHMQLFASPRWEEATNPWGPETGLPPEGCQFREARVAPGRKPFPLVLETLHIVDIHGIPLFIADSEVFFRNGGAVVRGTPSRSTRGYLRNGRYQFDDAVAADEAAVTVDIHRQGRRVISWQDMVQIPGAPMRRRRADREELLALVEDSSDPGLIRFEEAGSTIEFASTYADGLVLQFDGVICHSYADDAFHLPAEVMARLLASAKNIVRGAKSVALAGEAVLIAYTYRELITDRGKAIFIGTTRRPLLYTFAERQ